MKYIVIQVDSCERCYFLDGPECSKAGRIIRIEDTAPIPDWCPLPEGIKKGRDDPAYKMMDTLIKKLQAMVEDDRQDLESLRDKLDSIFEST